MFICIEDKGGKNGTVQDMSYHLPHSYLVRSDRLLSNEEIHQLIDAVARTRKSPRVVGVFSDEDERFPNVVNYAKLNIKQMDKP